MVQFLEDVKGTGAKPLTPEERIQLDELRRTVQSLRFRLDQQEEKKSNVAMINTRKHCDSDDEYGSSEDSECEQVAELPKPSAMLSQGKPKARTSVSAEAFGKYNAKGAYTVKVIEKSQATKEK